MHSLGSSDDISQHVHYTQMQPGSMDSINSLYSVSSGSLPSHFRSVSVKPEVHFSVESETYKRTSRCSTTTVYIILAAIFIVTSSVAIAIAVHEIHAIQNQHEKYPPFQQTINGSVSMSEKGITMEQNAEETAPSSTQTPTFQLNPGDRDPRTPCYKLCTAYGDPRFESRCIAGFCVCSGNDYQKKTCLPFVQGCSIQKDPDSRMAFIWGSQTTAYHCRQPNNISLEDIIPLVETHVIGIYGNHFSEATTIIFQDDVTNNVKPNRKPIRLVLASHYPIRWKLKNSNLQLSELVLVNDDKFSKSEVSTYQKEDSNVLPVQHLILPVGYGDDRFHSNTADLLRKLTERFGTVQSFLGASFADTLYVKL